MPFVKGVSGNAGGRPKDAHAIGELARSYAPEAIEKLVGIMRGEYGAKASDRVRAIDALLDRGLGKATQAIDLNAKGGLDVIIQYRGDKPNG